MSERVVIIKPGERTQGPPTPGMNREQAFATDGMWAGFVRTDPATVSAWHHHGEYDTAVFVTAGALRVESGLNGEESVEGVPGDFILIPKHVVHRELNPSDEVAGLVVVRAGHGESTFNVEEPAG